MEQSVLDLLTRAVEALERMAPPPPAALDLNIADAFIWQPAHSRLFPVRDIAGIDIALLKGVDRQKAILSENTIRFTKGFAANNAMLWGSRGMGKSSLVKAIHAMVNRETPGALALIEIHADDIRTLPDLLNLLRPQSRRCLILCDDLSFERGDANYKALKSVLDGGVESPPRNVLFYATSNRRHLMPRDMIDNERNSAINPNEAIDENVSLSDRFGLWLGFHNCDQPTFLAMVDGYAKTAKLPISAEQLHAEAVEWAMTRGTRSGRVAWQFMQEMVGRFGGSTDVMRHAPTGRASVEAAAD